MENLVPETVVLGIMQVLYLQITLIGLSISKRIMIRPTAFSGI